MKSEVRDIILKYGEPVELTTGGATLTVSASVQFPMMDPLVNDLDINSYLIYVSPIDVPAAPKKFDRILVRGKRLALDEDASVEYLSGIAVAYMLRVHG